MASVAKDRNGTRRILFVAPDGKRKTIRLGKVNQRTADAIKCRVEQLLAAKITGHAIEADTAGWVASLESPLADKLAAAGLIPKPEAKAGATLGAHLEGYFARRTDVKAGTLVHWRQTRRLLLDYFTAARPLDTITPGEAKDWERWLRTAAARAHRYDCREADEGLAPNTARKRVANAKQFFADAVQRDLIARNPFTGLKGTVGSNRERDYFVDRDTAAKVLEACPDAQWRLIFALSRFGGFRCPSEHLALTWADVNWSENRILVHSVKTEHHEGKGTRVVPIFPELRPYLEAVWDEAEPGTVNVITRYRDANANLRTQLERIIKRAGVSGWPKLFQNLRASRATELASEHPAHVAAAWLGHSQLTAVKHYWQVTDADFERAAGTAVPPAEQKPEQTGDEVRTECGALSAQNAAQRGIAKKCGESQEVSESVSPEEVLRLDACRNSLLRKGLVGDEGLEPPTLSV